MKEQDYSVTITVQTSPQEAFKAINKVKLWWTENLEGGSQKLNDQFTVQFGEVHVSTQKVVEMIPDQSVVWLVTESALNFVEDKAEWTGTKISFDIFQEDGKTKVRFTHSGLNPAIDCYEACSNAWGQYIQQSLKQLINTGKGQPTAKED